MSDELLELIKNSIVEKPTKDDLYKIAEFEPGVALIASYLHYGHLTTEQAFAASMIYLFERNKELQSDLLRLVQNMPCKILMDMPTTDGGPKS